MQKYLVSYDPSNGEVVGKVEITPVGQIGPIVQDARAAQKEWRKLSVDERISYIGRAAKLLEESSTELGKLLSVEMGKDFNRGMGEVRGCAADAVYRATEVKEAIKTQKMNGYGVETELQYNPLGVCGIITPWNYPMSMAHWFIIPALTAGNTVVLKPSEETPLIAEAYVEIFNKILPKGVLQIVHGDGEQGQVLTESEVDFIGFTGSQKVGKKIMKSASESLKRLVMELGGNDPLIVLEDADIDRAAGFAMGSSFENAGQMCIATERILVDEGIAEKFEEKLEEYSRYYRIGSWQDKNCNIGPIINKKQRDKILLQINEAIDKGAKVLAGGRNHPEYFIHPTVLTGITEDMLIYREETFGPVACVTRFKTKEDAVRMANDTSYGLGAVVFGERDVEEVANQMEAGMVGINQGIGGAGDTPWVGAKQSGYGYHGSPDGHRQFTQARVVSKRK